jgi:hypothetical protein
MFVEIFVRITQGRVVDKVTSQACAKGRSIHVIVGGSFSKMRSLEKSGPKKRLEDKPKSAECAASYTHRTRLLIDNTT